MKNSQAEQFIEKLTALQSDTELKKHERYLRFVSSDQASSDDFFIGVRIGRIFDPGRHGRINNWNSYLEKKNVEVWIK